MPSKEIKIRLPEKLHEQLRSVAEKQGRSIADIVKQLVIAFLTGSHQEDDIPNKIETIDAWKLRYPATCPACGKEIKAGEYATIVIYKYDDGRTKKEYWHPWCWKYSNDKTMVRLYLKKRELEKIVKALKKQADELADVINEAEARKKLLDIAREVENIAERSLESINNMYTFLQRYMFAKSEEEKERIWAEYQEAKLLLQRQYELLKQYSGKLEEIAAAMSIKVSVPRKKRRKEEETWTAWR